MLGHRYQLQTSKCFFYLMAVLWFATFIMLLIAPLKVSIKIVSLFLFFIYSYFLIKPVVGKSKNTVISIQKQADLWRLMTHEGTFQARLCKESVVTYKLLVLRFRIRPLKSLYCVVLPDSLPRGEFRRLLLEIKSTVR